MKTVKFDQAIYENMSYDSISCDGFIIRGIEFISCTFSLSSFQYAKFIDCTFDRCLFTGCNLSLIEDSGSRFIDTTFSKSKLLGINWSNSGVVFIASFNDCAMNENVFVDMNLNKFKFSSCSLVNGSFINTKLRNSVFEDCDLAGCQFNNTDLSHADFSTSKNYYMNASSNKLHKTTYSLPEAVSLLANLDILLR